MAITSIPEKYKSGFTKLRKLNSKSFKNIYNILSKAPIHNGIKSIAFYVSSKSGYSTKAVEDIFLSVGSLFSIKERYSIQNIVEDLANIMLHSEEKISQVSIKNFRSRLNKLLENEQLYLVSKINEIYSEHSNLFLSSKILTDIRPIFNKTNEEPKASILTNVLHIHFGKCDGDHEDIYIALDSKDIQELKKTIIRAEQKTETLKKIVNKSGMELLDPSEEN